MVPTVFGLISIAIGLLLLVRGTSLDLLRFMLLSTLFSGSAAILMPALGGAAISPAHLVLAFLLARILAPGSREYAHIAPAVTLNLFLVIYALYGFLSAFLLPRLFAWQIYVAPLRPVTITGLFDTVPLVFTNQNITSAVYLVGTMLAGVCATIVARKPESTRKIVSTFCLMAWIHAAFGVLGVVLTNIGLGEVLNIFRNGSAAQLEQSYNGLVRMTGVFPEPSYYASYAFGLFVFAFECWMRDIRPRQTGSAALVLLAVLVFSTSGSAYVSLAVYSALMVIRLLLMRQQLSPRKALVVLTLALVGIIAALGMVMIAPPLAEQLGDMFSHMTVDKADSESGRQRSFWALQGWHAFLASYGLGIGAGSFRSSSLFTAALGSMGVIGIVTLVCHIFAVFKPLRASTYSTPRDERLAIGSAASWTAVSILIPAAISTASPDPGMIFAVMAGLALEWRRRRSKVQVGRAPFRRVSVHPMAPQAPRTRS
ncbi:MAG TPA: hypothetical protein VIP08_02435 [Phenylobacterium sp.]|uniref:hypothetical protein n=1 Tax=Phenylobacterium sp. TaxID=1871053 RepID=UPI002F945C17